MDITVSLLKRLEKHPEFITQGDSGVYTIFSGSKKLCLLRKVDGKIEIAKIKNQDKNSLFFNLSQIYLKTKILKEKELLALWDKLESFFFDERIMENDVLSSLVEDMQYEALNAIADIRLSF